MFVVKYRKIFYALSIILIGVSVYALATFGLHLGIDFKGGSLVEVDYAVAPNTELIKSDIGSLNIGDFSVRPSGETGVLIRMKDLTAEERKLVIEKLTTKEGGTLKRFDSVGPVLGAELQKKSLWSIFWVLFAIVVFITFAFRHVSKPVASWKYGIVAIIALFHDVIIPAGVFAFLGHFKGVEVDALFVTAILVVLGFSIHDTIVVFDRTRENLRKHGEGKGKKEFEEIVGQSLSETFVRSINTSLTTLFALIVLFYVGPTETKNFVFALMIGIVAGTYSSIFIGSPLLVTLEKWQKKN